LLASLSAVIAGFILGKLASPLDFTLCFTFASLAMVISWIALAQTHEPARRVLPAPDESGSSRKNIDRILKNDANFRWFLLVRAVSQLAVMGFAFYTVYAVKFLGMDEVTVGILTGVLMGTSIIANPVMGWLADHWSPRSIMAVGMLAATASGLIAWWAPDAVWFFPVFILAAIANVAIWTIPMTLILMFGTESDRPYYIGMANTFIAPFTVLAPLFGGWLAEIAGYQATFIVSAIGGITTAALLQLMVRNPKPQLEPKYSPQESA
jgi:MFS family permease